MPKYTVTVLDRFIAAFGFVADDAVDIILGNRYSVPGIYAEDEPTGFSKIGTPFFDKMAFEYKAADGSATSYELQIPPMIDLTINKRLTITTINDAQVDGEIIGGGEVIESWGNESWGITIRGILVDMENHIRPKDQIQNLVNVFKLNDIIEVRTSRLFNIAGINQIYIKSLSLPALEGFEDTQPFVIEAKSYVPAVLEITD